MLRRTPLLMLWLLTAMFCAFGPAHAHDINLTAIRILYRSHDVVITVTTALSRLEAAEGGNGALTTAAAQDHAIRRRLQLSCDDKPYAWPEANLIVDRTADLICWQTVVPGVGHTFQAQGPLYPEDAQANTTLTILRDSRPVEEISLRSPQASPRLTEKRKAGGLQATFTRAIASQHLTPLVLMSALGLAFLFGALHALSPGHGKTMVAAALVGTHGTARHAVLLGAVVTLTHTVGVFALGLLTLSAAQNIVPERLYPLLSLLSGGMIVCVGCTLLVRQLRKRHATMSFEERFEDEEESEGAPMSAQTGNSLRSLILLGMTGGAVPCPSALVVMLSAIALHRIAFGLALILAFSFGLAVVLTGIGLLVVKLGSHMERLGGNSRLLTRLPALSAATILVLGVLVMARAFQGGF